MNSLLRAPFRRKWKAPMDGLVPYRARLFDERGRRFSQLRNANVLIYWPHGFGDFVHLGYLLPLFEPSNRYWIARYGDDFSALYRNETQFRMMPTGVTNVANCFGSSARDFHLGIRYGSQNGSSEELRVTPEFAERMRQAEIDTVLWTDYPDPNGTQTFPYHTKIRSLAQSLVAPVRLAQFDLGRRLVHASHFAADIVADTYVAQRLQALFGGRDITELCVVLSGGHTAPKKNWDEDAMRSFVETYIDARPARRAVVLLNDSPIAEALKRARPEFVSTWDTVFPDGTGAHDLAYAARIRAILQRSALMVGVPAGPMHLALAMGVPTVGLWRAHHPVAYEEPNASAVHIVTRNVHGAEHPQARIAKTVPAASISRQLLLDEDTIPASIVGEVAEALLAK
jgi:hypothetical protein